MLWLMLTRPIITRQKCPYKQPENPKPLVKNSHVFLRLFEESKMCFKCTDMYSTKKLRIILLKLFCLCSCVCAQEKKDKNFLLSLFFASTVIYIPK